MAEKEDILSKKKIEVVSKDIEEDIQSRVVDICMAVKDFSDLDNISMVIKNALDKKFGTGWNVIIGESFTGKCSIAKGYFLQLKIANIFILIFKSNATVKK